MSWRASPRAKTGIWRGRPRVGRVTPVAKLSAAKRVDDVVDVVEHRALRCFLLPTHRSTALAAPTIGAHAVRGRLRHAPAMRARRLGRVAKLVRRSANPPSAHPQPL